MPMDRKTIMPSRTKKKTARKKHRKITLHDLWSRENGICCICGTPVSMLEATREHKVPRAHGGKDGKNYNNIGIAHESCNKRKGHELWHFTGSH